MKLVVTGALGHIGSRLIRESALVESADSIVLVDNLSTQRLPSLFRLPRGASYTLLAADVEDAVTPELLSDCDAVIHLAAVTEPGAAVADPDRVFGNNLRITRQVAAACLRASVPLVFVSSTSVYAGTEPIVSEDSEALNPQSPYAQCKLLEERCVQEVAEEGLPTVIFRFGTIFGISPGMRFHTAVNRFCWQAALSEPIEVWSTALDQQRPYLDVADAARLLARTVLESVYPGEVVNAVTRNATVRNVIDAIAACGRWPEVRLIESPLMNSTSFLTSADKAMSLGFEFTGDLEVAVRETMELLGEL